MTNCPNCGAPFTGRKCEYCGTRDPDRKNEVRIFVDTPKLPPPEHWATIGERVYYMGAEA